MESTVCLHSAEERRRQMALKSMRNPLSKQLPAVRRVSSDVRRLSGKITCTTSELDVNPQPQIAGDEQLRGSDSEEKLLIVRKPSVSQSAMEVMGDVPLVVRKPSVSQSAMEVMGDEPLVVRELTSYSVDRVTSGFQSEFLKMLSGSKHRMSDTSECTLKQLKVNNTLVDKKPAASVVLYEGHQPADSVVTSEGFSWASSSVCDDTNSQQSTTEMQESINTENDLRDDATDSTATPSCTQTSSLNCDSATVSAVAPSSSRVVSADMHRSEETVAKLDSSVSAEATSALCEAVQLGDVWTSAEDESCSTSPPVLSLPDPVTSARSVDICPPVLEPSYYASDDSDAASADVSDNSKERHLIKTLENTSNELQSDEQYLALSSNTSSADMTESTCISHCVICSTETSSSATVSVSCALNPQLHCQVDSSAADCKPTSSFRFSSLAKFRPTLSAVSLLRPSNTSSFKTGDTSRHMTQDARPNLNRNSSVQHSSSVLQWVVCCCQLFFGSDDLPAVKVPFHQCVGSLHISCLNTCRQIVGLVMVVAAYSYVNLGSY